MVAVLSTHYKVEIMEGPSKGEIHKYTKDMVTSMPTGVSLGSTEGICEGNGNSTARTFAQAFTDDQAATGALEPSGNASTEMDANVIETAKKDEPISVEELWGDF